MRPLYEGRALLLPGSPAFQADSLPSESPGKPPWNSAPVKSLFLSAHSSHHPPTDSLLTLTPRWLWRPRQGRLLNFLLSFHFYTGVQSRVRAWKKIEYIKNIIILNTVIWSHFSLPRKGRKNTAVMPLKAVFTLPGRGHMGELLTRLSKVCSAV